MSEIQLPLLFHGTFEEYVGAVHQWLEERKADRYARLCLLNLNRPRIVEFLQALHEGDEPPEDCAKVLVDDCRFYGYAP
jgi:hypothetical protein